MPYGTFIFNIRTRELYVHNFTATSITAHRCLLNVTGWKREDCIGGSIKQDGNIDFRSLTINSANTGNEI